ncbi:MAG: cyclic nucleotide-binding domain-containing protein [Gemmatimonadales bacterium]
MLDRLFILQRTDIFGGLPDNVLTSLATYLDDVNVEEGETIFRKGDIGKYMFIVVDGTMRIHDGETTLAILGPGHVFGEMAVLDSEIRSASATASEECRLLRLDQDLLYEVMAGNADVSRGIIDVLLERFQ